MDPPLHWSKVGDFDRRHQTIKEKKKNSTHFSIQCSQKSIPVMLKFPDARFIIFDNMTNLDNQSRGDGSTPWPAALLLHPAGRALTYDWSANSSIMVVYENYF